QRMAPAEALVFVQAGTVERQQVYECDRAQTGDECGDFSQIIRIVVEAGNHWNPNPNVPMNFIQRLEIFENATIGNAGQFFVPLVVERLQVIQHQVGNV